MCYALVSPVVSKDCNSQTHLRYTTYFCQSWRCKEGQCFCQHSNQWKQQSLDLWTLETHHLPVQQKVCQTLLHTLEKWLQKDLLKADAFFSISNFEKWLLAMSSHTHRKLLHWSLPKFINISRLIVLIEKFSSLLWTHFLLLTFSMRGQLTNIVELLHACLRWENWPNVDSIFHIVD